MNAQIEEYVDEFLAAVEADNSKTIQEKTSIRDHVKRFAQFVQAKVDAPVSETVKVA